MGKQGGCKNKQQTTKNKFKSNTGHTKKTVSEPLYFGISLTITTFVLNGISLHKIYRLFYLFRLNCLYTEKTFNLRDQWALYIIDVCLGHCSCMCVKQISRSYKQMLENIESAIKNGKSRETGNIHRVHTTKTNNYRQVKTSSINKTWDIMKTTRGTDELLYTPTLIIYSTCCHWLLFTDVITNDYKGTT